VVHPAHIEIVVMSREPNPVAQGPLEGPEPLHGATPAALHEAGLKHLMEGRPLEAQVCCQQALAIQGDHAATLHLMGLLALQAGQHDHAVEWLTRAIRQDPRTDFLTTLGVTLKQMGRLDEALKVFDKAVQLKPDDAELWKHLAGALLALNRSAEALLAYQHALHLDPRHWEAAYQSGLILHRMERFEEALAQLDRCVALRGDHVPTLQMHARALRSLKRYEECLADNMRAYALDAADAFTCNNIGDALQLLGRHEEGLAWFDKALLLRPETAEIFYNKGFALHQLHRHDEAIAAFERAVALDPSHTRAAYDLSHLLLVTGNLGAGFAAREVRWKLPDFSQNYPKLSQPKWLGEAPIDGKTLLICADEGLGDTIQFARYLPLLAARGAKVILVVHEALQPLLSRTPGVAECLPFSAELPPFDLHCPMMSLPLALHTTLATIPPAQYLPPLADERIARWRDRLSRHDSLRVGLVWSGNPNYRNDHNRSLPLRTLAPLFDLDATFVSLQKDPRAEDAAFLREHPDIVDLTAELTDFIETAALVSCLDLVISVDTGVAHLAGTLARPTWILLPYVNDWRWLSDREDSPWYPTVRLFRQDSERDYVGVIARMRDELLGMISTFAECKDQASRPMPPAG
jgi:tetratricopeptide (TPR) repeat protein